jgi:predicted RNase H-like nuclease (RuvC/YqgF family)
VITTVWLSNETLESIIRDYRKEKERLEEKRESFNSDYEGHSERLDELIEKVNDELQKLKTELENRRESDEL